MPRQAIIRHNENSKQNYDRNGERDESTPTTAWSNHDVQTREADTCPSSVVPLGHSYRIPRDLYCHEIDGPRWLGPHWLRDLRKYPVIGLQVSDTWRLIVNWHSDTICVPCSLSIN